MLKFSNLINHSLVRLNSLKIFIRSISYSHEDRHEEMLRRTQHFMGLPHNLTSLFLKLSQSIFLDSNGKFNMFCRTFVLWYSYILKGCDPLSSVHVEDLKDSSLNLPKITYPDTELVKKLLNRKFAFFDVEGGLNSFTLYSVFVLQGITIKQKLDETDLHNQSKGYIFFDPSLNMYFDHSGLFRSMQILRTCMKELESNELSSQFLLLKTYNFSLIISFWKI